jgi:recombination protein RecT
MSLAASVMLAAQLGLEPGTFGHCYLIPYGRDCQFQIGYRGLLELVRRSGQVVSINCEPVYAKDEFSIVLGLDHTITHRPFLDGDRGDLKLVYAVAKLKDGGVQTAWMTAAEIQAHRRKFSKNNSKNHPSPWDTDFVEMAKKTVLKRLCKTLPISVDILRPIETDGARPTNIAADMVETSVVVHDEDEAPGGVDPATGEVQA